MLASPITQYPLEKNQTNSPKNSKNQSPNSLNCRGSPQVTIGTKRSLVSSGISKHNLSIKKFIKQFKIDSAENSSCSSSDSENNCNNIENMNPDNPIEQLKNKNAASKRSSKSLSNSPMKMSFKPSNILQNRKRHTDSMDCSSNHVPKKFIRPYQHTAVMTSNYIHNSDPNGMSDGSSNLQDKSLKDSSSRTLDNLCTDSLKNTFESKFKYYKKLKQLPSQIIKAQQSSSSLVKDSRKVNVDDAIKILEHILVEQEEKLKEEFEVELHKRLNDQYESFQRFKEDFMKNAGPNAGTYECSYLS